MGSMGRVGEVIMVPVGVPVFRGDNYNFWRAKMKTMLRYQGVWEAVNEETGDQMDEEKKSKALLLIQMGVDERIFPLIAGAGEARQAWKTLDQVFQGSDKDKVIRLQKLRHDFDSLFMADNESLPDFFTRAMTLVHNIRFNGDPLPDHKIVQKILTNMPPSLHPLVSIIEQTKDVSTCSVDELIGSLYALHDRLSQFP